METTLIDLINVTRYYWLPVAVGVAVWALERTLRDILAGLSR